MNYLRLLIGGLAAFGSLSAAGAAEYPGMAVEAHAVPYHGGYAAGCHNCGPAGYSYGIGWGVPGCCERPISGADHLWDGYCDEKVHLGHCSPCFSCSRGMLFPGHYHAKGCTNCTSCTSGAGVNTMQPAVELHDAPPPPPASSARHKPAAPKTSRARTRGPI